MSTRLTILAAAVLALAGPAAASSYRLGALQIDHPWIRATAPGAPTAAGYMAVVNSGGASDRLLGGSTRAAQGLSVHQSMQMNGMSHMMAVDALAVPARGSVTLKPGGYHLMLTGLKGPLVVGQIVPVTLRFEKAGSVQLDFVVESGAPTSAAPTSAAAGAPGAHAGH